jgi:hypothetical protein
MKNTDKMIAMFGKYTDTEIADSLGLSRQYVATHRKKMGIDPVRKWSRLFGLLGVKSDKEIAEMAGVSINAVIRKRLREGIEPVGLSRERILQDDFVKRLNSPSEYVRTPYGIIDVLTDDCIYELKSPLSTSAAQQAVGQLLIYQNKYKGKRLVIVTDDVKISKDIQNAIKKQGIEILHLSIKKG